MHEELLVRLEGELDAGRMSEAQVLDTLLQKAHFDAYRRQLRAAYPGKFVGFVRGHRYVEDDLATLLKTTRRQRGQLYFEPIPPAFLEVAR